MLPNDKASPAAIDAAVEKLAHMKRDDVAIVFLAGHGVKAGKSGDMVFLTGAARVRAGTLDPQSLDATVSWSELGRRIERIPGRVLVLVDACHSGHMQQELLVPNDDMARRLAGSGRAGVVIFAAAKGRQVSNEPGGERGLALSKLPRIVKTPEGHGLFTAALIKSLGDSETDRNGDGAVQLSELVEEVSWRVRKISREVVHQEQTPWIVRRELFGDFVVGSVKR